MAGGGGCREGRDLRSPYVLPHGTLRPNPDPVLLDVNEMVQKLKSEGVRVERYLLNAQPQAFVSNPEVYRLIRERKLAVLPVTAVNGQIIKAGAYPTLDEVKQALEHRT